MTLILALAACSGGKDEVSLPSAVDSDAPTTPSATGPRCDKGMKSGCDSQRSIVRGAVRLADGLDGPTTGDLYLALTHDLYDGQLGGGYHTHTVMRDVDLGEPVEFAIDMCADGADMWSEDNCGYGLVVVLDQDGDQDGDKILPDPGEPATRVGDLWLSCAEEPPCLDVVLDCVDGESCARFTEPASCECAEPACPSIVALCGYGY